MKFGEDGCRWKGPVVLHEVVDCSSYTGELRYHVRFITGMEIICLCQFTQAICFSVCNVPCLIVHGVAFTKQQEGSLKAITDTQHVALVVYTSAVPGQQVLNRVCGRALCGFVEHSIKPVT